MFGENSRAIATLTRLLQTPYAGGFLYFPMPVTPALLRLDPIWDPLRSRSRFPKTLRGKAAVKTRIIGIVTRHELHELSRTGCSSGVN